MGGGGGKERSFEFPQTGKMTHVLQPWPVFWSSWQSGHKKEASSEMYLESKESHVPTSVWNDQLTGKSQWDDGMLVDEGRERPCGRRQHVRTGVPESGPGR